MKNLKVKFKLIICFILFLNTTNVILAKNLDKFSNAKDISNYFSGVLSINDNQYKKSYSYLKKLNNLEDSHHRYSQHYQYSLISLKKFRDAAIYSQKLEDKKIDNFESNLISTVYHLQNKDMKNTLLNLQKLENKSQPGTIQNLLFSTLNTWVNLKNTPDLNSALILLEATPERFEGIKKIQKTFAYCYFDSPKTDEMYKQLTANADINYSRYNFFYSTYLISKNKKKKAKEILVSALKQQPNNLIINQLKTDLEKGNVSTNKFDCKNTKDVIAEIFYIVSNALAVQKNYMTSNFYLRIANYLNPNFVSFNTLYAENLFLIQEYKEAKEIYNMVKKKGSVYNWHASKQIAFIFFKQNKKQIAINSLKESFEKIKKPSMYEIFDYAEFLKNNEKYEESIKYYTDVLNLIDTNNHLYAKVMDGRGIAYERNNQWTKAEIDLLNSLNASPDDAYVINYLAYSWIEKGINVQKALEMLRKANKLKPNDGYIIDSLGWALFKLKNYKEANQYLELAIQYMASDPVINDHYADSLWMNNKSLQARYYWNYVLKLKKTEEKLKKKIEKKLLFGLKS